MTKCHHFLPVLLSVLLFAACKPAPKGPSLSEYGANSEASEQVRFEKYVQHLLAAAPEQARTMQDSLLRDAAQDSARWNRIVKLEELFLFDPNSPYRDEERYLPVVEHLLVSPLASEQQRMFAQWAAPRLSLNRLGTKAADFAFMSSDGRRHTLYQTVDARKPRPRLILLFFSNPGCPNCKEITEALTNDLTIAALMDSGELLVINTYPDEDLQAWLDYLPNYPRQWVCGYDPDQVLNSHTVYWLRAIPSLYLLDDQLRVLRKDAPLEQILIDCKQR